MSPVTGEVTTCVEQHAWTAGAMGWDQVGCAEEGAAPSSQGRGPQRGEAEHFPMALLLQTSSGTAACHPTTRCCTTGTWRRGCTLSPSRACQRKVGDGEKEAGGKERERETETETERERRCSQLLCLPQFLWQT